MSLRTPRELAGMAELRTDLCIIGAGAAGIALARAFLGTGTEVTLIAGGGKEIRRRTQALYAGRNVGRESFGLTKSRIRTFGGSTAGWAGQCRPLDGVDFEPRSGLPHTGWPIGPDDLAPFYPETAAICDLEDWRFDPPDTPGLPANREGGVEHVRYRHGHRVNFLDTHGPDLEAAPNVEVLLDTHATEIVAEGDGVTHVAAVTEERQRLRIRADRYVLATGGIENARLLLASRGGHPAGLGNDRDLVGRYFMDHPFFFGGVLDLAPGVTGAEIGALEGYEKAGIAQRVHGGIAVSERDRRNNASGGACVFFVGRAAHKSSPAYLSEGGVALTRLIDIATGRESADGRLARHGPALARRAGEAGRSALERVAGALRPGRALAARFTLEALPKPESRVGLDPARRDRFGRPLSRVDWRLTDIDRRGLLRLRNGLQRMFASGEVGQLRLHAAERRDGWPVGMEGGKHHMGTTRMAEDARLGVVDPDCRMHGVENLYVAGSSVFPTGGYANPTFTIVALALRLAAHLKTS
ncbi:MAG: GMC oxidoreductase [Paracoccaceae bacterium]|nr:GMC oxidoreductase [Paracoccaceae bacterium]